MNLKKRFSYSPFIFAVMLLSSILFCAGCNAESDRATNIYTAPTFPHEWTNTPIKLNDGKTHTPEPNGGQITATATSSTSEGTTLPLEPGKLPDILLNLGARGGEDGESESKTQIWISSYPYQSGEPLLSDGVFDYRFPMWSPDGEWIAYIQSETIALGSGRMGNVPSGTDSLWVMRADGSEKRQIGGSMQRYSLYSPETGWYLNQVMQGYLVWSPDGRYIAFHYFSAGSRIHYIVDVVSGETQELCVEEDYYTPVWVPERSELIIVGDSITVFDGNTLQEISSREIPYPVEIPDGAKFGAFGRQKYVAQVIGRDLIGSFNIFEFPHPHYLSLWKLNLESGEWTQLRDHTKDEWGSPILGWHRAAACGLDKSIYVLNPADWETVDVCEFRSCTFTCNMMTVLQDDLGQDIVSYPGYLSEPESNVPGGYGIYVAVLDSIKLAPQLLVSLETLGTPSEYSEVIDYSWKVISE